MRYVQAVFVQTTAPEGHEMDKDTPSQFLRLDEAVCAVILQHLLLLDDGVSVLRLGQTCRLWKHLVRDEQWWGSRCAERFSQICASKGNFEGGFPHLPRVHLPDAGMRKPVKATSCAPACTANFTLSHHASHTAELLRSTAAINKLLMVNTRDS